ncbi:MAG: transporter substrate-binding domain-containing protein [Parasporobacterium sp.]|nr:transporter substrate-binding domain-containing protein [Parasporobacterium sp.]
MKSFKKVISLVLVAVFAVGMLAACGGTNGGDAAPAPAGSSAAPAPAGSSAAPAPAASEGGTLSMATNAAFPPYEFMEGGDYAGIDIEIAQAIADSMGAELVINDVEFGSIIGGVQSGKYDMGIAGMTVTDERLQSVNFSESYATGVQVVIVKEDSAIASADDLAKANKIGVQMDTTGDIYCCEDFGDDHVTEFKTGADAVQALVTDKVDCVVIDNEPAKAYVEANEGLKILDTEYVVEDYAICVAKENTELLDKINAAIADLKKSGKLDEIIGKYIK